MPKLVLLTAGMTGRAHELKLEKTTVGRVEDNTFQIPEPSVSSHHCELVVKGEEVLVRDLGSTNGTFINGEKIAESPLKTGQILRLGQIEMRLENDTISAPAARKPADQTLVMQRGVSLSDLEQATRANGFDTTGAGFTRKQSSANRLFVIGGAFLVLVIIILLTYAFFAARGTH
jgi:pSer/pThr/pTyr-binding forkhead associated (FHA) protein